jgi:hypothetical protein
MSARDHVQPQSALEKPIGAPMDGLSAGHARSASAAARSLNRWPTGVKVPYLVRRALGEILQQQPDVGAKKLVFNWFFEPTHIFEPTARRPVKLEVVIILSYFTLMAAVFAAFNLI